MQFTVYMSEFNEKECMGTVQQEQIKVPDQE